MSSSFTTRRHLAKFVSLATTLLAGCATLTGKGGSTPSDAQIDAAYEQRDAATLKRWCDDMSPEPTRFAGTASVRERKAAGDKACRRLERLQAAEQKEGALTAFTSQLDCDNAVTAFQTLVASQPAPEDKVIQDAFVATGEKLVECKRFPDLFGKLLAYDVQPLSSDRKLRYAYRLLDKLAAAGAPIADEIVTFSRDNTYDFQGAGPAADAIATFLREQKLTKDCGVLAPAMQSNTTRVLAHFMDYFAFSKCKKAGAAVAATMTRLQVPDLHIAACATLAAIGDPAHRGIVSKFARNDGTVVVKRGVKIYPVRDACNSALTRL